MVGAFVLAAYDSALRLGDVLSIRFDQVDAEFTIVQQKTGDLHKVFLQPQTIVAVTSIRLPVRQLVFEWKHSRQTFYTRFNRIIKDAGVRPGTSKFIRRSSASYIERDNPGMAMRHLGHRTPGLAERNYIDPTIVRTERPRPPAIG